LADAAASPGDESRFSGEQPVSKDRHILLYAESIIVA